MFSRLSSFVQRHSLAVFFVLAYAISWSPSVTEPHGILPLGPLIAALIVIAVTSRWTGVKAFLGRIIQWRVGLRWYALVLGLPVLIIASAVALNVLLGARAPTFDRMPPLADLIPMFLSIMLIIGVGEEPAWRGFALPRLMAGRSALAAALLLSVLHTMWHLPLFGLEYNFQNGFPEFAGIMAFAVLTTWVYNHTCGNLLLPILFHTSNNVAAKYLFNPLFSGTDVIQLWWLFAALWWVPAILVILVTGRNLARKPSTQPIAPVEPVPAV